MRKESFGIREEDYLLTTLSLSHTHHFVVDDDNDNGGEEECDPFDQIKRKKGKEESEVWRKDVAFDGHCLWIVNENNIDREKETKV